MPGLNIIRRGARKSLSLTIAMFAKKAKFTHLTNMNTIDFTITQHLTIVAIAKQTNTALISSISSASDCSLSTLSISTQYNAFCYFTTT
jgi:hypothetical protein